MRLRTAATHPAALSILAVGLGLAGAATFLPPLRAWSGTAGWVALWGLLAYGAAVAIVRGARPSDAAPELRTLLEIRHEIVARLAERRALDGTDPSELTRVLGDALVQLEDQLTPALRKLLERHMTLRKHLARYQRGELPPPQAEVLERLHTISAREQAAIEECVRQAANAYATLIAILQERDDSIIAMRARDWAGHLLTLHDAMDELLRGGPTVVG